MGIHLTPLQVCQRLIGSNELIGEVCGIHPKSPYPWARKSTGREAGDIPHANHMRRLLAHSAARGLGLTAEHLIWGADEAEIEAILAARPPTPPQLEAAE